MDKNLHISWIEMVIQAVVKTCDLFLDFVGILLIFFSSWIEMVIDAAVNTCDREPDPLMP